VPPRGAPHSQDCAAPAPAAPISVTARLSHSLSVTTNNTLKKLEI
jgi:hypothetical protein